MLNEKQRYYGKTKSIKVDLLRVVFNADRFKYMPIVLLFGSRALHKSHERSDYDFAVLLEEDENEAWGMLSKAWVDIGVSLKLSEVDYDVVDLGAATAEMKSSIKNGYTILKGDKNDISAILG